MPIQKRIIGNTYGIGSLFDPIDFYRNGLTQKEKPINLSKGSIITDLSINNLPSPRMVIEDNRMKNAKLLPYYDGIDETTLDKKQKYIL